jgi:hypothetical protein
MTLLEIHVRGLSECPVSPGFIPELDGDTAPTRAQSDSWTICTVSRTLGKGVRPILLSLDQNERKVRMAYEFKVVASPMGRLKLVASHDRLVAIPWESDRPGRADGARRQHAASGSSAQFVPTHFFNNAFDTK